MDTGDRENVDPSPGPVSTVNTVLSGKDKRLQFRGRGLDLSSTELNYYSCKKEEVKKMLDDEKGYNGWKNYETWAVALWIDNDQSTYNESRELISDCTQVHEAADILKEWIEDMNPLSDPASLFSDLLSAALSEVDWYEIAQNYLIERTDNEMYPEGDELK